MLCHVPHAGTHEKWRKTKRSLLMMYSIVFQCAQFSNNFFANYCNFDKPISLTFSHCKIDGYSLPLFGRLLLLWLFSNLNFLANISATFCHFILSPSIHFGSIASKYLLCEQILKVMKLNRSSWKIGLFAL